MLIYIQRKPGICKLLRLHSFFIAVTTTFWGGRCISSDLCPRFTCRLLKGTAALPENGTK